MVESGKLMEMPEKDMLARIEMAKFPQQLTPLDKHLLAVACITYGFDPLMGELTIYQGRPYVSIDGRYRKAQETKELDGVNTRPATKKEREDWGIPEGDYFFRAEVYRKGAAYPFVGWGRVRAKETDAPKDLTHAGFRPLETNPQRMAEKRAEAQALRKGFHIPLPSWEEREEGDFPNVVVITEVEKKLSPPTNPATATTPGGIEAPRATPGPNVKVSPEGPKPPSPVGEKVENGEDLFPTFSSAGDLANRIHNDKGIVNEVLKVLDKKSVSELKTQDDWQAAWKAHLNLKRGKLI